MWCINLTRYRGHQIPALFAANQVCVLYLAFLPDDSKRRFLEYFALFTNNFSRRTKHVVCAVRTLGIALNVQSIFSSISSCLSP